MGTTLLDTFFLTAKLLTASSTVVLHLKPSASDAFADPDAHRPVFLPARTRSTSVEEDDSGGVNYYAEASAGTVLDWKRKLGRFLLGEVVKPHLRAMGQTFGTERVDTAVLYNFPDGYKLLTHYKGDKHEPRRDAYLFGSRHVPIFRSPLEFYLHLKWLVQGMPPPSSVPLPRTRPSSTSSPQPQPQPQTLTGCHCKYCDPASTQSSIRAQYAKYTYLHAHHEAAALHAISRFSSSSPADDIATTTTPSDLSSTAPRRRRGELSLRERLLKRGRGAGTGRVAALGRGSGYASGGRGSTAVEPVRAKDYTKLSPGAVARVPSAPVGGGGAGAGER